MSEEKEVDAWEVEISLSEEKESAMKVTLSEKSWPERILSGQFSVEQLHRAGFPSTMDLKLAKEVLERAVLGEASAPSLSMQKRFYHHAGKLILDGVFVPPTTKKEEEKADEKEAMEADEDGKEKESSGGVGMKVEMLCKLPLKIQQPLFVMDNPVVLIVGVAQFQGPGGKEQCKECSAGECGKWHNLPSVHEDVKKAKQLFGEQLGYQVICSEDYLEEDEYMDFLTDEGDGIGKGLRDATKKGKERHDGLVVVICGHGDEGDTLVTSGEDKNGQVPTIAMTKVYHMLEDAIRRKFAWFLLLPRVYFVDACRGRSNAASSHWVMNVPEDFDDEDAIKRSLDGGSPPEVIGHRGMSSSSSANVGVHRDKRRVVVHGTVPGETTADTKQGGVLIGALCKVLSGKSDQELRAVPLRTVVWQMGDLITQNTNGNQTATYNTTMLREEVFFQRRRNAKKGKEEAVVVFTLKKEEDEAQFGGKGGKGGAAGGGGEEEDLKETSVALEQPTKMHVFRSEEEWPEALRNPKLRRSRISWYEFFHVSGSRDKEKWWNAVKDQDALSARVWKLRRICWLQLNGEVRVARGRYAVMWRVKIAGSRLDFFANWHVGLTKCGMQGPATKKGHEFITAGGDAKGATDVYFQHTKNAGPLVTQAGKGFVYLFFGILSVRHETKVFFELSGENSHWCSGLVVDCVELIDLSYADEGEGKAAPAPPPSSHSTASQPKMPGLLARARNRDEDMI